MMQSSPSQSAKPVALLVNDDGIESLFLKKLAEAFVQRFEVWVVAPNEEKSASSHSISYRKLLELKQVQQEPYQSYALSGTPSDCVNLALGNLLPQKPDVVVSGLNLGSNATLPLFFLSGTIGAALEGSFWGIPSFAFSYRIPRDQFHALREQSGHTEDATIASSRDESCRLAAEIVWGTYHHHHKLALMQSALGHDQHQTLQDCATIFNHSSTKQPGLAPLYNINFPYLVTPKTAFKQTKLAPMGMRGLYLKEASLPGSEAYRFHRLNMDHVIALPGSDYQALEDGYVSIAPIDLTQMIPTSVPADLAPSL